MASRTSLRINLSFKIEEEELYLYIKGKRSPSSYIKDAVEFYRASKNELEKNDTFSSDSQYSDLDAEGLLDF